MLNNGSVSTKLLNGQKYRYNLRSEYALDMWREVRKRWLVLGVLVAVLMAVLGPKVGAPGGPLHTEYLSYLPLSYIYYSAGGRSRGAGGACGARAAGVAVVHAHVFAPALCIAVVEGFRWAGVDFRVLNGAILSSVGAPCAWLAVSWSHDCRAAVTLASLNYIVALVATPFTMIFICGRATIPHLSGIISTVATTVTPFLIGALRQQQFNDSATKLAAFLLLYVDCCQRFCDAEGSLYVGDVFTTLLLEVSWVVVSAAACWTYARCGALAPAELHTVLLCAVPKGLQYGLQSSTACTPSGLSSLPAVFLSPAQALVMAAVTTDEECDDDDDDYSDGSVGNSVKYLTLPQ